MHSIHCHFERIPDVLAVELLNAWGVYVLWHGHAKARPTYIGEGNIWQRFLDHRTWASRPFDGYVAILDERRTASVKRDLQIVEAALLCVAEETDRRPARNAKGGTFARMIPLFGPHGVVKIFVDGLDPLQDPVSSRALTLKKHIRITVSADSAFEIEHDWRKRRNAMKKANRT